MAVVVVVVVAAVVVAGFVVVFVVLTNCRNRLSEQNARSIVRTLGHLVFSPSNKGISVL